jgi:hypothetical protein
MQNAVEDAGQTHDAHHASTGCPQEQVGYVQPSMGLVMKETLQAHPIGFQIPIADQISR